MATELWSPVYILEAISTDVAGTFETSGFGMVAFGVSSFGGTPDVCREFWSGISTSSTNE